MNIVRLIFQNLRKGTVSFRLPHRHECTSDEYRGLIQNDASRCIGCGACAYVCPTAAIEVKRSADKYSWSYDPGKCTFCARCIDRCRPNTLSIESKLPPLYSVQGELKQVLEMVRKKVVRPTAPAAAKLDVVANATAASATALSQPVVPATQAENAPPSA